MTESKNKKHKGENLREVLADLHIHVGFVGERPIKIPASSDLILGNILKKSRDLGIRIIGLADCNSGPVREEIAAWMKKGELTELPGGGLDWQQSVTLIPAAEVETSEGLSTIPGRPARRSHHMIYFNDLERLDVFNRLWKEARLRGRIGAADASYLASRVDGLFIPAHIFTPHKGLLGCSADHIGEVFEDRGEIPAVEVGLSADSSMADRLSEMEGRSFFTNSDAHSLAKIGREHNSLLLAGENLSEVRMAVRRQAGRRVAANFGMLPVLGKYYRSCCRICRTITPLPPSVQKCGECGSTSMDMGVLDRVEMIADRQDPNHPSHRPPYHHLIPLEAFPGIGPKKARRLLEEYGSEKNVLWKSDRDSLDKIVGPKTAELIICSRSGDIVVTPGGGGRFGKIDRTRK